MARKECTCLFHWILSLKKRIKQLITLMFQYQHKALYHEYKQFHFFGRGQCAIYYNTMLVVFLWGCYFLCSFYTLKPTYFAQTYCFMIFTQILLKFCDIGSL